MSTTAAEYIRRELDRGELAGIAAKVEAGERLTREDGIRLWESKDLFLPGNLPQAAFLPGPGRHFPVYPPGSSDFLSPAGRPPV